MPLYFFDFSDTGVSYPDTEGTELTGLDAAKDEAVRALMEMAREMLPDGAYRELTFKVRDETGRHIVQVAIKFELKTNQPVSIP